MEMAAKANALRWFGRVSRTEVDDSVRMAWNFEVRGKKERHKNTWMEKFKDSSQKSCMKEERMLLIALSRGNVIGLLKIG